MRHSPEAPGSLAQLKTKEAVIAAKLVHIRFRPAQGSQQLIPGVCLSAEGKSVEADTD